MFTHVFDIEMKRVFFDENIQWQYKAYMDYAFCDRQIAYDAYKVAVKDMMRFGRTIDYAGFTLQYLRHDEKWDKYVRSDKLQQKAKSVLNITHSMREFHEWRMSKYTINYIY
jgi:hypothetical protein